MGCVDALVQDRVVAALRETDLPLKEYRGKEIELSWASAPRQLAHEDHSGVIIFIEKRNKLVCRFSRNRYETTGPAPVLSSHKISEI